jgi:hypothetical protein
LSAGQRVWSGVEGGLGAVGTVGLGASAASRAGSMAVTAARVEAAGVRATPSLRQQYIDEVVGLKDLGLSARAAGAGADSVARMLHAERRALGVQYKDLTPADELARITQRNIIRYNDPLGPSVAWLRGRGKTWEQIIESASTPGGKDLGY